MNRPFLNSATISAFCIGITLLSLGLGSYFHYEPCFLCIIQRGALGGIGLLYLLAAVWPRVNKVVDILGLIGVTLGELTAGRQLLLILQPAQPMPCAAHWEILLQELPFTEFLRWAFSGAGADCAEKSATWLGLPLAAWALLCFIGLEGVILFRLITKHQR